MLPEILNTKKSFNIIKFVLLLIIIDLQKVRHRLFCERAQQFWLIFAIEDQRKFISFEEVTW